MLKICAICHFISVGSKNHRIININNGIVIANLSSYINYFRNKLFASININVVFIRYDTKCKNIGYLDREISETKQ